MLLAFIYWIVLYRTTTYKETLQQCQTQHMFVHDFVAISWLMRILAIQRYQGRAAVPLPQALCGELQLVCLELELSIDIAVQQEQPLASPSLAATSVDAERTMTSSKHKGTVYPDVSVIWYLMDKNIDFRTLISTNMGHDGVDYLICAKLKRSISRALVVQGLTFEDAGYKALAKSLRKAAF